MAKTRVTFLCRSCGSSHPRWMGKCPDCGTWDALEKFVPPAEEPQHQSLGAVAAWIAHGDVGGAEGIGSGLGGGAADLKAVALPLDRVSPLEAPRIATGIGELDRVLGGGVVPSSAVLVGGDPGIGKSTLLLQAAACMSDAGQRVLYVSSEESAQQVKMRAERVLVAEEGEATPRGRMSDLYILSETNLARIAEQARRVKPALLVIDSIQMLWSSAVEAAPGSATQLRRACLELVTLAKASEMAVAMVGHVTKEGELAGPKLLEHLVDVVVQFEGDRHHAHRVVRALKNRFGSTQEIGLFEMTGSGLAEIREGSLSLGDGDGDGPRPGTIHVPSLAGSRCLIAEMQALTATSVLGSAKRRASGIDASRLAMLIAVLEKHAGLRLADQDVFAQAAGGLRIIEPAADLSIAMAIAGAHYGRAASATCAAIGEVGLTGEIRSVRQLEQRIGEVVRRGGRLIAVPESQRESAARCVRGLTSAPGEPVHDPVGGVNLVGLRSIAQAVDLLTAVPIAGERGRRQNSVKA